MNKKIIFTLSALLTLGGLSSCRDTTTVTSISVINNNLKYSFQVGSTITNYDFDVSCNLSNGEHRMLTKKDYTVEGTSLPHTLTADDLERGYVDFTFKYNGKSARKKLSVKPIFGVRNVNIMRLDNVPFTIPFSSFKGVYFDAYDAKGTTIESFDSSTCTAKVYSGASVGDFAYILACRQTESGVQILDKCKITVVPAVSYNNELDFTNKTALLSKNPDDVKEEYIIPTFALGCRVIGLKTQSGSFENSPQIKKVEIPDTVEVINSNAFKNCPNLESVKFGSNVYDIGENAFEGCLSLKEVNLTDNISYIEDNAFIGCSNIEKVNLRSATFLTYIGKDAFGSSNKITLTKDACKYVTFYLDGVKVPYFALTNVDAAAKTLRVDDTTKFICCASDKDNEIEKLIIPSNVAVICESSFENKANLKEIEFEYGSRLSYIGPNAFREATGLTNVRIPSYVSCIGSHAFYSESSNILSTKFEENYGWYYYETHVINDLVEIDTKELTNEVNLTQLITREHLQDPAGYCDFFWYRF